MEAVDSSGLDDGAILESLNHESKKLSDMFVLMQKQCAHRLSKISYFILGMSDLRLLNDSGCKWIINESTSRRKEFESAIDLINCDDAIHKMFQHHSALGDIERKAACCLRKRTIWLEAFVNKVESQYEVLDKLYNEISEYVLLELENEETQLPILYKEFYVEKEKFLSASQPAPSASSLSEKQLSTQNSRFDKLPDSPPAPLSSSSSSSSVSSSQGVSGASVLMNAVSAAKLLGTSLLGAIVGRRSDAMVGQLSDGQRYRESNGSSTSRAMQHLDQQETLSDIEDKECEFDGDQMSTAVGGAATSSSSSVAQNATKGVISLEESEDEEPSKKLSKECPASVSRTLIRMSPSLNTVSKLSRGGEEYRKSVGTDVYDALRICYDEPDDETQLIETDYVEEDDIQYPPSFSAGSSRRSESMTVLGPAVRRASASASTTREAKSDSDDDIEIINQPSNGDRRKSSGIDIDDIGDTPRYQGSSSGRHIAEDYDLSSSNSRSSRERRPLSFSDRYQYPVANEDCARDRPRPQRAPKKAFKSESPDYSEDDEDDVDKDGEEEWQEGSEAGQDKKKKKRGRTSKSCDDFIAPEDDEDDEEEGGDEKEKPKKPMRRRKSTSAPPKKKKGSKDLHDLTDLTDLT